MVANNAKIRIHDAADSRTELRHSKRSLATFALRAGVSLLAIGQGSGAWAQADDADQRGLGIEEIIVTARKQAESIMDVSVTAMGLSGSQIARRGLVNIHELTEQTPSIRFDKGTGGGGGTLTIRGIGSSTIDSGVDQTVPVVIDGLQTTRGHYVDLGFLDLAQIEVLKGPQALFFGKNSPAGVLSLNSARPTEEFEGYVRASYATEVGETELEGAISGPLSETVRGRLAVKWRDTDGWLKNVAGVAPNPFFDIPPFASAAEPTVGPAPYDKNDTETVSARLTLEWTPNEDLTAILRISGTRNEDNGPAAATEQLNCGGATTTDTLGVPDPFGDCKLDNRQSIGPVPPKLIPSDSTYKDGVPYGEFEAILTSLTFEYQAGDVHWTSVTGYMEYDFPRILNNPTIYAYGSLTQDENWAQFSQEIRLVTTFDSSVNFAGGVYYENTEMDQYTVFNLFPHPADFNTGQFNSYVYEAETGGDSYSVFGQVRWAISDTLQLDVGARYMYDERDAALGNSYLNPIVPLFGVPLEAQGVLISGDENYDNISPEVTLSWTGMEGTLLFLSYRTGYKAGGGASPQILTAGFDPETALFYKDEDIAGFEAGLKSILLDGTLQLTASVYTYEYNDLQVSNFDAQRFTVQPLPADLDTEGFEITAIFQPVPGLTLYGAVGYSKAEYSDFPGVSCYNGQDAPFVEVSPDFPNMSTAGCFTGPLGSRVQDLSGQQKFRAPEWTGNFGFYYETPLGSSGVLLGLSGSVFSSDDYISQENGSPFAEFGGYEIYNAGIHLKSADETWELAVIGKNLGDEQYVMSSLDTPNAVATPGVLEGIPSRPRQIMFQGSYRF